MILHHFTDLGALIGADGLAAVDKAMGDGESIGIDANAFADPSSILRAGILPRQPGHYDHVLRAPMPPCVWLTSDPDMPADFCNSHSGFRISVAIPSTDRLLVPWPKWWRKHGAGELVHPEGEAMTQRGARASANWWLYFGTVTPERIRALEAVPHRPVQAAA